jgi:bacterioferritin
MTQLDLKQTIQLLNLILEFELAGVVRYTNYAVIAAKAADHLGIATFFKEQANESLEHAQQVGEMLIQLDNASPRFQITPVEQDHLSVPDLLEASSQHEQSALRLYQVLLKTVQNVHPALEAFAIRMIETESSHEAEFQVMRQQLQQPSK